MFCKNTNSPYIIQQISSQYAESFNHPLSQQVFKQKHLNHDFFLLVRDQYFQQAYALGQKILLKQPHNHAIRNFCQYIKQNYDGLIEMADEERNYQEQSEEEQEQDIDQIGESDGESQEEEEDQVESNISSSRKSSVISKKSSSLSAKKDVQIVGIKKVDMNIVKNNNNKVGIKNLGSNNKIPIQKRSSVSSSPTNKQNAYKWQHNCKNPNCPNKKPHKAHKI